MLNGKFKRAVAITGIVFMLVFTVSLPLYLAKPELWSGRVGLIALFSGALGLICFFIVWMDKRAAAREKRLNDAGRDAVADKTDDTDKKGARIVSGGKNDLPPQDRL